MVSLPKPAWPHLLPTLTASPQGSVNTGTQAWVHHCLQQAGAEWGMGRLAAVWSAESSWLFSGVSQTAQDSVSLETTLFSP